MPTKLTSKEKKGKTKSERKIALKIKRAEEHKKFLTGFIEVEKVVKDEIIVEEKVVKPKKIYKNPKKLARVASAEARLEKSKDRTPQQQLNILDNKLGVGVGATKERNKIRLKLNKIEEELKKQKEEKIKEEKKENQDKVKLKAKDRRAKEQKKNK